MFCPSCKSLKIIKHKIKYHTFTHLNFQVFNKDNSNIYFCENCTLIFRSRKSLKKIRSMFLSNNYLENTQIAKFKKNKDTNIYKKAKFISSFFQTKKVNNILDVGCFNGELIFNLAKNLKFKKIIGLDIIKNLPKSVNNNINFTNIKIDQLNEKFDIICFSHSIIYFDDLNLVFKNLKNISHENTLIFIFIPDIELRPLHILLSDQFYYLNNYSLLKLLNRFKFSLLNHKNTFDIKKKHFEIKKNQSKNLKNNFKKIHINFYLENIYKIYEKLIIYKEVSKLYIFGTTIESAFSSLILKDQIVCYVDEDLSKVNSCFFGKNIIHPNKLSIENVILVLSSNNKLFKRLKKTYKGKFILI